MVTVALASWGPGLVLPTPTADATFMWLARTRLGVPIDRSATAVVLARLLDVASLLLVGLLTAPLAGVHLPLIAQVGVGLAVVGILAVMGGLLWAPTRVRRALRGTTQTTCMCSRSIRATRRTRITRFTSQ